MTAVGFINCSPMGFFPSSKGFIKMKSTLDDIPSTMNEALELVKNVDALYVIDDPDNSVTQMDANSLYQYCVENRRFYIA